MKMTADQFQRLQYLLGKRVVTHVLTSAEEIEVRALVACEDPELARREFDRVVDYGLIVIGAQLLSRKLASLA
ncbi:MAG: hypothetical protein QOE90_1858 [Thermoplasmata archaeon]|jgi:hypothetical protein|nr:hypothetical protein [Thermoplasmata archaeon]